MPPFLVLLVPYLLSQFDRSFLAIIAGDLTRDLGLGPRELGAVSGIWFAAFALAQFPVGYALDRHGPRRTLAAFTLAAVLGAAVMAGAGSYGALLLGMALVGVGCAPALMASMVVFARTAAPHRFATLSGALIGLGSAGNLLAATPLTLAAGTFGWRGALAGLAGLHLAAAILAFLALRDPPPLPPGPRRSGWAELREIASLRALWPMLPLVAVSYAVVAAERGLWIAPFLAGAHGLGRLEVGNAALFMAGAMALGALAYGPAERLAGGAKRAVLAGCLVTGLLFLALALLPPGQAFPAMALLAGIGFFGMSYGTLMSHGRLFVPPRLIGRGVTFLNFGFIGGAGLIQWLSGTGIGLARAGGAGAGETYAGLHMAFGLALILASVVYAFAPARPRASAS